VLPHPFYLPLAVSRSAGLSPPLLTLSRFSRSGPSSLRMLQTSIHVACIPAGLLRLLILILAALRARGKRERETARVHVHEREAARHNASFLRLGLGPRISIAIPLSATMTTSFSPSPPRPPLSLRLSFSFSLFLPLQIRAGGKSSQSRAAREDPCPIKEVRPFASEPPGAGRAGPHRSQQAWKIDRLVAVFQHAAPFSRGATFR